MTNANSHFSIVIPAKNEEAFITQTLLSIAEQTCVDSATPIFLCDAHSVDATVALAQQVAATYQLNLTIAAGGLPPAARNSGARLVKTPFVLFMDADVILGEPNTLAIVLETAETQALDLVVTHIRPDQGNLLDRIFWRLFSVASRLKLGGPVATGSFMFMRMEAFRAAGGFDERMLLGDDIELARAIQPSRYAIAPTFMRTSMRRFHSYGYLRTFTEYLLAFLSKKRRLTDRKAYFAVDYTAQSDATLNNSPSHRDKQTHQ